MNDVEDESKVIQLDNIRVPYKIVLRRLGGSVDRQDRNKEMERIYNDQIER